MPPTHQDQLLDRHLGALLGDLEPDTLSLLRRRLQWVVLPAGQTLMRQGDPGDSMYLSVSGRLRAYVRDEDGAERMVREMARGQVIGEMALYTGEPRSATVVAIRDSVLVRLGKDDFHQLLEASPRLSLAMTRQLIRRLQAPQTRTDLARPVCVAMVPVSAGVDLRDVALRLAEPLRAAGRVGVVDAARIDAELGTPGLAQSALQDADADRRISLHLDALEAAHEYLLLLADDGPSPWTQRCTRHCDELLLLADADQPPVLHANETGCLMQRTGRSEAAETLVLLHAADKRLPRRTREWLARRPVAEHVHVRPALQRDLARLARILSQTAVGLVLAGGGARGLAHLGVMKALRERGVEIDWVYGTSIGAAMAGLVAVDRPTDETLLAAREAFMGSPTGDFNLLPLMSLIKGRRLTAAVDGAIRRLAGFDADLEDLWINCGCVASNYSQASEQLLRRGPLRPAVLASTAIPGALPPVLLDGDLLCDGGTFNNFPVDAMRKVPAVGTVIGVDLAFRKTRKLTFEQMPGTWALLRDRWRPRAARRYRLPSLMAYLMNVTVLYSSSRQRQAQRLCDLYFNPPLSRVGMLQWKRFDEIVEQGHAHALQILDSRAVAEVESD